MHEYLAVYTNNQSYGHCTDCSKRTPHVCTKCNYCYSCHPKIERIEKEAQANVLIRYYRKEQKQLQRVSFVTYRIRSSKKWGYCVLVKISTQNFTQYPIQRLYFCPKVLDISSVMSRMYVIFCLLNLIFNFLFQLRQFTHIMQVLISHRYIGWRTRGREGPCSSISQSCGLRLLWTFLNTLKLVNIASVRALFLSFLRAPLFLLVFW